MEHTEVISMTTFLSFMNRIVDCVNIATSRSRIIYVRTVIFYLQFNFVKVNYKLEENGRQWNAEIGCYWGEIFT